MFYGSELKAQDVLWAGRQSQHGGDAFRGKHLKVPQTLTQDQIAAAYCQEVAGGVRVNTASMFTVLTGIQLELGKVLDPEPITAEELKIQLRTQNHSSWRNKCCCLLDYQVGKQPKCETEISDSRVFFLLSLFGAEESVSHTEDSNISRCCIYSIKCLLLNFMAQI